MSDWNKGNGATFGLNQYGITVEDGTCGTHPGTEQRPVCRRLMLSMVSSVFSCLSLGQTADGKNAEYE